MTNITAQKIADMLTENTGGSMLDSGGFYGRHWERNTGKTLADFMAAPAGTIDENGELTIDLFHYLNDRLEYAAALDAAWSQYDGDHPNESWMENIETFLDMLGVSSNAGYYEGGRWGFNSYNFDGCLLSQTIQGTAFDLGGTEYLILQVHGGCDVRGGYTRPVVFTGEVESVLAGMNDAFLRCTVQNCEFYVDYCHGEINDYNMPESKATPDMLIEVTVPREWEPSDDWNAANGCPIDHAPLIIQGR
jgi:hypothetical protein